MKAFMHKTRDAFTIAAPDKGWRCTYPIDQLANWFGIYAKLANPKLCPKGHQHHAETHLALVAIKKQLEAL